MAHHFLHPYNVRIADHVALQESKKILHEFWSRDIIVDIPGNSFANVSVPDFDDQQGSGWNY